jgi:hypothetical protein
MNVFVQNLRRHILRLPVYVDESVSLAAASNSFFQQNPYQNGQQPMNYPQQQPLVPSQPSPSFIPPGYNPQQAQFQLPQYQRIALDSNKQRTRRRRQINTPTNNNLPSAQLSQKQVLLPNQQQQMFPNVLQNVMPSQQQIFPHQQQVFSSQGTQQQQQQQQQIFPNLQQNILPNQQQQQQQQIFPSVQQNVLPNQQQIFPNVQQNLLPTQQPQMFPSQSNLDSNTMPVYPSQSLFQHGQIYPTMDPQFSVQAQTSIGPNGNSKKRWHVFVV